MLARFSVKKPYTVLVAIALVIVLGVVSLTRMTADLFPSMDFPYAIVMTSYPGASPEEVEEAVTKPIESAMASTSNIKHINSTSSENYSTVVLEFEQNANMDSVTIEMRESLDQISGYFPDEVGSPIIMKINPDMLPIMVAAVDVDEMDRGEISQYVEDDLIPELESVEGVASVGSSGSLEETIEVRLNQDKIDSLNKDIKASLDKSFADAQDEMDDAREELESGRSELEDGKSQLTGSVSDAQAQLYDQRMQLMLTEQNLNSQLAELEGTQSQLTSAIESASQLAEAASSLQQAMSIPADMQAASGVDTSSLQSQYNALNQQAMALGQQLGMTITIDTLPSAVAELNSQLAQVNAGIAQAQAGLQEVEGGKASINSALAELNRNQVLGAIDMGSATAQLDSGEQQLDQAEDDLEAQKENAYESASLDNILTMDMIRSVLTAQNFSMPAGYVTEGKDQYLIRVGDEVKDISDLEDLVLLDLHMDGIDPIHVADVADVSLVNNEDEVYASINGNPGIMVSVEKQTGYATGDVTDSVLERFDRLEAENEGLHLTVLMDQGIYIDMIVDSVMQNMVIGGILAVIILLLFLKDIRPTAVIACAIPVSVIFAVVLMYFTGVTLNVISLSGLALGIGMLVDNSIVVIENIYRLRSQGEPVKRAAVEGAKQVTGAIVASTLTTVCVFVPIVFTEGITRQLFVDMGLTIAYSLMASLIIALTFVPMMASGVLKRTSEKKHPWFERVQSGYRSLMGTLLRFKPLVFLAVIALLVVSVFAALSNGTAFMTEMESPQLMVTITPPEGSDTAEAGALSEEVISRISDLEDIDTIGAMASGGGLLGGNGDSTVSMYIMLKDEPQMTNAQMTKEILSRTEDLDGEISVNSSAMDMSLLGGSGISVMVKGRNMETLENVAVDISQILEDMEGTAEVSDGIEETIPQFEVRVDKEKAAKYDMTVAQVFQLVNAKLADETAATTLATDVKDYDVYTFAADSAELTREDIRKLTFTYTDKEGNEEEVSLSRIAEFKETEGLSSINRDAQERYLTVTASIADGYNIGLVARDVEDALKAYDCPEGISWEMTGEDETINEAIDQVMLMLVLAVVFVYLIMVAQFQSLLSPFIIMFTMPLAFTGGFLALFISGSEVSVIALIGFVMLTGIIVNNGIVMVDYTNQLRMEGMDKKEAILEAGVTRLRPILMTALTTIIAMLPMALGLDSGSEMMQPMALVVVGGMVYGTLLTLVVIPCIYDAFHRNKSMVEEDF